jgi:hypothetical protein
MQHFAPATHRLLTKSISIAYRWACTAGITDHRSLPRQPPSAHHLQLPPPKRHPLARQLHNTCTCHTHISSPYNPAALAQTEQVLIKPNQLSFRCFHCSTELHATEPPTPLACKPHSSSHTIHLTTTAHVSRFSTAWPAQIHASCQVCNSGQQQPPTAPPATQEQAACHEPQPPGYRHDCSCRAKHRATTAHPADSALHGQRRVFATACPLCQFAAQQDPC